MKITIVGVDLAKDVIQVCVYANKKVQSNTEMAHHEFLEWLFNISHTKAWLDANFKRWLLDDATAAIR